MKGACGPEVQLGGSSLVILAAVVCRPCSRGETWKDEQIEILRVGRVLFPEQEKGNAA